MLISPDFWLVGGGAWRQFLGFLYRDLRQSLVDIEAMFDTLSTEPKLKSGSQVLPPSSKGLAVEVKDVHFGYALKDNKSRKVLHGVSFSVASGDSVAIVGPSGSGKSTLVKLLLRIFDPEEGRLGLDGCDVKELTLVKGGRGTRCQERTQRD